MDILLPAALGLAGSAFSGPDGLAPALEAAGVGAGTAGLIAPAIGGAVGSTAGNIAAGHPLGQSLAMGCRWRRRLGCRRRAYGRIGRRRRRDGERQQAGLGKLRPGGWRVAHWALLKPQSADWAGLRRLFPNAGAAPAMAAGAGAATPALPPTAGIGGDVGAKALAGAAPDYAEMARQYMAANPATGDTSLKATGGLYDTPKPSWMKTMTDALGLDNPKKLIGSTLGGAIGSSLGESLFPSTYKPPGQTGNNDSGYSNPYRPRGAPVFQTPDQLRNYGRGPQFNYYPV